MALYEVFHRTWWIAPGEPGVGEPHHIEYVETEEEAHAACRAWNDNNEPGPLSDKAEYWKV